MPATTGRIPSPSIAIKAKTNMNLFGEKLF
jgi:hypothetical protein